MDTANHDPKRPETPADSASTGSVSTAPLAGASSGRLVFTGGAIGVRLQGDPALAELYRARFVQQAPNVYGATEPLGTGQRIITIHYGQRTLAEWQLREREPLADLTLQGALPWEIEFHGGVSHLEADLRRLRLRSLDLSDSSRVWVHLPQPAQRVYLYFNGSASEVTILRPVHTALRVQIGGSASNVRIDAQQIGAVANGLTWQTHDYGAATDRYDIHFAGSVSNVTLTDTEL